MTTSVRSLPARDLCQPCDPEQFDFETTESLADLEEVIGQKRAVEAVQFGIGIQRHGYNIFALGPSGTGRHSLIRRFLHEASAQRPMPSDWCYVHNFEHPHQPRALSLPVGMGTRLHKEMAELVEDLGTALPAAFESDDYRARRKVFEQEFKTQQEAAFSALQREAQQHDLTLLRTSEGLVFAPYINDEVLSPEEFQKLPEAEREVVEGNVKLLQDKLQQVLQEVPRWERTLRQQLRELNREVVQVTIEPQVQEVREPFAQLPEVLTYLDAVQKDIVTNIGEFFRADEAREDEDGDGEGHPPQLLSALRRYRVNVIVDHSAAQGAPVIYEGNPTLQNLVGRIEQVAHMGTLVTDFTLIKPGALHQANGGYLMLDAYKILSQLHAWEGLKRALQFGQIRIESPLELLSLTSTVSLEPEPIPLDVKVALIGERQIYYLLCAYDPDFGELFKVAADFDDQMERSGANQQLYARLLATLARREALRPLDRSAVAQVIERSARITGDAERLTTRMQDILDLLQEADYWARQAGSPLIQGDHVQRAVDAQISRQDRMRERLAEQILRGTVLLDSSGSHVGQINGLSVLELGNFAFGRPSRITARVSLGSGAVVDIEREVELGGPLHSKGVLILAGFLQGRYAADQPLPLTARLVFEQSYGDVDGDSASSAELYALLSAITNVPLRQSLAVTGSVNQYGQVQAIGGVNEKIEGFFDICQARGLTGDQGVLIPTGNVKHLMLRRDVVQAVADGRFQVFAVETVDEGIALLTGLPAGAPDADGNYPAGSINQRVAARLADLAQKRRAHGFAGQERDG